jgi:hypothetical protein
MLLTYVAMAFIDALSAPSKLPMRSFFKVLWALSFTVAACGGVASSDDAGVGADGGKDSGLRVDSGRDGGRINPSMDGGVRTDAGSIPWIDPACPTPPPPITNYRCNLRAQTGCQPGEGCYAFVLYPSSSCEAETYGSGCAPEGPGVQYSPCGSGSGCKAGYDCVISGRGTICAKHCDLNRPGSCPEGHVCEATDVLDVGVCD